MHLELSPVRQGRVSCFKHLTCSSSAKNRSGAFLIEVLHAQDDTLLKRCAYAVLSQCPFKALDVPHRPFFLAVKRGISRRAREFHDTVLIKQCLHICIMEYGIAVIARPSFLNYFNISPSFGFDKLGSYKFMPCQNIKFGY